MTTAITACCRRHRIVLACPPAVEVSIYQIRRARIEHLRGGGEIQQPFGDPRGTARKTGVFDLAASPTAPDLASRFANGREIVLPDASHFIAMEEPDLVAEQIRNRRKLLLIKQVGAANPSPLNTTSEIRSVAAMS